MSLENNILFFSLKPNKGIDDVAFQLFAMHCCIERGDKTKENSTGKNDYVVNITK